MKYIIVWSEFAERQLDEIFAYYAEKSKSTETAKRLIKRIITAPEILKTSPYIGQKEILLESRKIEYRYLIESNYKIIYTVNEEKREIRISDVFDTRQNPVTINRNR